MRNRAYATMLVAEVARDGKEPCARPPVHRAAELTRAGEGIDAGPAKESYIVEVSTLQLVCPPLATWLPRRILGENGKARARLLALAELSGELREILADLPDLDMPLPGLHHTASGLEVKDPFDALVLVSQSSAPIAGGVDALAWVRPGGLIVEITRVAPHWLPWIVGLPSSVGLTRELIRASKRATQWSMLGLFEVEQWLCRDPGDYVITLGRLRCQPPRAESSSPQEPVGSPLAVARFHDEPEQR